MAAYRRVYDSRHLQADCQEPGSAPEPYDRQSTMGYIVLTYRSARSVTSTAARPLERCPDVPPLNNTDAVDVDAAGRQLGGAWRRASSRHPTVNLAAPTLPW